MSNFELIVFVILILFFICTTIFAIAHLKDDVNNLEEQNKKLDKELKILRVNYEFQKELINKLITNKEEIK